MPSLADLPHDVYAVVYSRLDSRTRLVLRASDPYAFRNFEMDQVDTKLALISEAVNIGQSTLFSIDTVRFLRRNIGHRDADALWSRISDWHIAKVVNLEAAIQSGVFDMGPFPERLSTSEQSSMIRMMVELPLDPLRFDSFLDSGHFHVVFPSDFNMSSYFIDTAGAVLAEHVFWRMSKGDLNWDRAPYYKAYNNVTLDTVRELQEVGLSEERWSLFICLAIAQDRFEVVDYLLSEGYKLDGSRVPERRARTKNAVSAPGNGSGDRAWIDRVRLVAKSCALGVATFLFVKLLVAATAV